MTAVWKAFEPRFAVGRGQFGVVFLCQHEDGRKVVDKRVGLAGLGPKELQSTTKELDLLKQLEHPYIVRYLDHFVRADPTHGDILHIIMEYCSAGSLKDQIEAQTELNRPFGVETVRRWLLQLMLALRFVHEQRVIHRDIKPANVFLLESPSNTPSNTPIAKLGDFGCSRPLSAHTDFAATCIGTPFYLAPELIAGTGYDSRVDVWALGVLLYELLTLRRPFEGDTIPTLAHRICNEPLPPLPSETPTELRELTERMLQKQPDQRAACAEMLNAEPLANWPELGSLASDSLAGTVEAFSELCVSVESSTNSHSAAKEEPMPHGIFVWQSSCQYPIGGGPAAPNWRRQENLPDEPFIDMCASCSAVAVVSQSGELWCWSTPQQEEELEFAKSRRPARLCTTNGLLIRKVALADRLLLALADGGVSYEWDQSICSLRLIQELSDHNVSAIACGAEHCMACTKEGLLFAWGVGDEGQLGLGDLEDREVPSLVPLEGVCNVSAGKASTVLLLADGSVMSCGSEGECSGTSHDGDSNIFRAVHLPLCAPVVIVACGYSHSAVLSEDGRVISWGSSDGGRLGRKRAAGVSLVAHERPAIVSRLEDVCSISVGPNHTVAVTRSGEMWAWGCICDATQPTPVRVGGEQLGSATFLHTHASEWFTLAIARESPESP